MKRIEDIKEFKDIDTYYEISKIVEEVFEDRVEAHKHLVTANKEIERLNNIINKAKIYCESVIQEHENGNYDVDTTWLAIKEHKGNIASVLNILNGDLENYWRNDKE